MLMHTCMTLKDRGKRKISQSIVLAIDCDIYMAHCLGPLLPYSYGRYSIPRIHQEERSHFLKYFFA